MSDKKQFQKHPNRKVKSTAPAVALSPEERAKLRAALEKAEADRKAEVERIQLYGEAVPKMSHRQLRSELVKTIRREHIGKPPQPQAGLTIALASVFLTVLDNTKTVGVFDNGKRPRPDQINPNGRLHFSLR
jgi:hypothetical protein